MNQQKMPALFIGHGSPMNVIEDNQYTQAWQAITQKIAKPKAILVVSAHWYTRGTGVTGMVQPKTIHDFGGFPQALYDIEYPAPGDPELAERIKTLLSPVSVIVDHSQWGLDHGAWCLLVKMYPQADIPVLQLSLDGTQPASYHYELGKKLAQLREEGVLIIGSGNVVHNLRMADWHNTQGPYDWAERFNQLVKTNLTYSGDEQLHPLVNYEQDPDAKFAVPTSEHYLPLLYVLGAWDKQEDISVIVDGIEMRSLSMMSIQVG